MIGLKRIMMMAAAFFVLAYTAALIPAATEAPADAPESVSAVTQAPPPLPTGQPTPAEPETAATEPAPDYQPRLSAPDPDDPRYYSDENIFYAAGYGMPNCTCYAWGRAYELTGEAPALSPYDACTWYDYNAENGIYPCGDTPKQGAVACWAYADGGSGHVAVVEDISDGVLTFSNSAYAGTAFYTDSAPADNPSADREGWIFRGYIYVTER